MIMQQILKKKVNVSGHHLFADRHISYGIPPFGGFSSSRFHESSRLHHWNIRDLCFLLRIPDTSMTENIIMSSPSILVEERGDWYKSTLENDHRLRSGFEPTTFRSWERTSTAELTCWPLQSPSIKGFKRFLRMVDGHEKIDFLL